MFAAPSEALVWAIIIGTPIFFVALIAVVTVVYMRAARNKRWGVFALITILLANFIASTRTRRWPQ